MFILADTLRRAQSIAELLAAEPQIEVLRASVPDAAERADLTFVDVVIGAEIAPGQLPDEATAILLTADRNIAAPQRQVKACLPLQVTGEELAGAIAAVAQEFVVLTAAQAQSRLRTPGIESGRVEIEWEPLTGRESQVLRKLADGLGNKEIAAQLKISDHTVKFHVAQILAKLRAGSRAEAVALGMRRGLIPV